MAEQEASVEESESSAFSPKDIALFAVRATRENLWLCLAAAIGVAALGITVVAALPQYYDATCKVFIQEGGSVTSWIASGQDAYKPGDGSRGLQEFILARDNLLSIAREAKLFESWPKARPWPMRIIDSARKALLGPPDRKGMERVFAEMLGGAITAAKDGDSSVRIHAQWRDGQSAYEVARLVLRNFLAARSSHDLGPIQRAIPFLEEQLQEAEQEIETSINRVQTAMNNGPGTPAPAAPKAPDAAAAPPKPAGPDPRALELANLSRELSATRRQQRTMTDYRRQRVTELKMALIDLKTQYSDDHPLVRQQEARIAAMGEVPEELAALRQKESQLLSALASRGVARTAEDQPSAVAQGMSATSTELAPLFSRVGTAIRKSEEVAARLETARIELATAEADFKHRYVVVEEPEVPDQPLKPKKKLLLYLAVALVSLIAGVLAGTLRELRRGRLVELWQVRALGVELLGEVNLK